MSKYGYTENTEKSIATWGADNCLAAYKMYSDDGEDVTTISYEFSNGDTINGDRLINAGREISAKRNAKL